MKPLIKSFHLFLAAAILSALSACGGSVASSLVGDPTVIPPLGQGLTPQVERLIAEKYSSHPELKRAAEGWANAKLAQMKAAVDTGVYSRSTTMKDVHSQTCLMARAKRLGGHIDESAVSEFLAALTPTVEHLRAFKKANSLSSGNPVHLSFDEAEACSIAEIQ